MKGVTLPSASTGKEFKDAPVLSVSDAGIFLDQKRMGSIEEVLKNPNTLLIKLGDLRKLWTKANPTSDFSGEITLQAHKEVPSTVISKLMAILPSAHYGSIQLAVTAGG
jgi:biopolymer transport protein ExbD